MVELIRAAIAPFLVCFLILLNSSCGCKSVCACIEIGITVEYLDADGNCNDTDGLFQTTVIDEFNNIELENDESRTAGPCEVFLFMEESVYWVIQSDSLNINDTIRINNLIYNPDMSTECCKCGPSINTATLLVNDSIYIGPEIVRTY